MSTPGPEPDSRIHYRIERADDERFVVTNVLIHGPHVTSDVLRQIPVARVEALANLADATRRADDPSADAGIVMFADTLSIGRSDDELTLGKLRSREPKAAPKAPERLQLARPDGSDPDAFYRDVARAYSSAAQESRRPAAVLAEEAGVPVTTVHRWIREARRRGFLGPGSKGRAG